MLKKSTLGLILSSVVCLSAIGGSYDAMNAATLAVPVQKPAVQPVKLTFTPAEITREVRKVNIPDSALPLTPEKAIRYLLGADQLLKTQPTSVGNIVLYSKQGDHENFYAAYLTKDVLYELGEIGSLPSLDLTKVSMATLNKTPLMKIRGVYGAKVVETTYFYLIGKEPVPLLVLEGPLREEDLDGDGFKELVSTSGTPPVTNIYKYIEGRFQTANLNSQLNAVSVVQQKDPTLFEVVLEGQDRPVTFKYSAGTMQPVTR